MIADSSLSWNVTNFEELAYKIIFQIGTTLFVVCLSKIYPNKCAIREIAAICS